ncbi:basic phospholipase A2 PA-10A isoform X2 [Tribolium madens]|uniref:basic phospholipase A2 PA-10A isoform X2 n=1 Tax=Tribolium madens TaxID=41895 RepID=UPI001CF74E1A|nr:basic phospholipase A2 PA-10A isoform X2 [Tribolium madens]
MHFFKLLVLYFCNFSDGSWRTKTTLSKLQDFHNVTIYLGYANNPFGASSPALLNKKKTHVDDPRPKRGVIHLYNMVSCATGCNPLIYKGYGCYCGFLGSGYAVDGIDRCCKMHDWCYNTANCPMYLEYFVPYFWKCYRNRPLSVPEHQRGGPGSCPQRLCECDRILSQCLSQFPCPSKRAFCRASPWRLFQNLFMGLE